MNRIIVFILGCLTGMLVTILVIFAFAAIFTEAQELGQESIYSFSINYNNKNTTLYLSMPKDSVKMLLGQPSDVRVSTILDDVHETWEYFDTFPGSYSPIQIEFINGMLTGANQY